MKEGVGILSDAHGNGLAFRKAVQLLTSRGATRFVFLGDALGYIASNSVLETIRDMRGSIICLLGNHEKAILSGNFGGHSEPVYQHEVISRMLSNRERREIAQWPIRHEECYPESSALFIHGTPDNPVEGYMYPDTEIREPMTHHDFVFMGNTHRPFIRREQGTTYVNVGSCGLPRDHGHYGSAGLFSPATKEVVVYRFDIREETRTAMSLAPETHRTVIKLSERTSGAMFGDLV